MPLPGGQPGTSRATLRRKQGTARRAHVPPMDDLDKPFVRQKCLRLGAHFRMSFDSAPMRVPDSITIDP